MIWTEQKIIELVKKDQRALRRALEVLSKYMMLCVPSLEKSKKKALEYVIDNVDILVSCAKKKQKAKRIIPGSLVKFDSRILADMWDKEENYVVAFVISNNLQDYDGFPITLLVNSSEIEESILDIDVDSIEFI